MAKKKAITGFRGLALAEVLENSVLAYESRAAFSLPYAGSMSRTAKERTGDIFYDDDIYAQVSDVVGEEVEIRIGEVSLNMLETLGLGVYNEDMNRLEAAFGLTPKQYALRCVTDTVDKVPYYFNWRVFELGSIRFDNFSTQNNSVAVCEVILKGLLKNPLMATVKPLAIMQLKDDASNQSACEAFMARGETFPVSAVPVITIDAQPADTACVAEGTATLAVEATATLGATPTYQWYEADERVNTGGTLITGATGATLTLTGEATATAGTAYYYCVVSATGAMDVTSEAASCVVIAA